MHLFFYSAGSLIRLAFPGRRNPLLSEMRLRSGIVQDHMGPGGSLSGIVI